MSVVVVGPAVPACGTITMSNVACGKSSRLLVKLRRWMTEFVFCFPVKV